MSSGLTNELRGTRIFGIDPEASRLVGEYDAAANQPNLDTLPIPLGFALKGYKFLINTDGVFFTQTVEAGDVLEACCDNPTTVNEWIIYQTALGNAPAGAAITINTGDWVLVSGDTYRYDFTHGLATEDIQAQFKNPSTDEFLRVEDYLTLDANNLRILVKGNTQAVRAIVSAAVSATNNVGLPLRSITTVSTDTVLTFENDYVRSNDSGAATNQIITMPSAIGLTGKLFTIKKVTGAPKYTSIAFVLGQTWDGNTGDFILGNGGDITNLISDGANWDVSGRRTFSFGSINKVGGTTTQPLTATPVVMDAFNNDVFSTPGRITADQANNKLIIDDIQQAQDAYKVSFNCTYDYSNSINVFFELYAEGNPTGITASNQGAGTGDHVSASFNDALFVSVEPTNLEIRVSAGSSSTISYIDASFTIERIGG